MRRKRNFKLKSKHLVSLILVISMLSSILPIVTFAEKNAEGTIDTNSISEVQNQRDTSNHLFSYDGRIETEFEETENMPMLFNMPKLFSAKNTSTVCGVWYDVFEDDEMTFVPEVSGNYTFYFKSSEGYISLDIGTAGYWVGQYGENLSKIVCKNLKAGEEYFIDSYCDMSFMIEYAGEPSEYTISGRVLRNADGFVNIEQQSSNNGWCNYGLAIDDSTDDNLRLGDEGEFIVSSDNVITSYTLTKETEQIVCDETKQVTLSGNDVYYYFIPEENGTYLFDLFCDSWGYCELLDSTGVSLGHFDAYFTYHNMKKGNNYFLKLYGYDNAEIKVSLETTGLKSFELVGTVDGIFDYWISETESIKRYSIYDDKYNTYYYFLDNEFCNTLHYGDSGTFTINEDNYIAEFDLTNGILEIKCGDTVSGTAIDSSVPTYSFIPEEDGTYKFDLTVNIEGDERIYYEIYPENETGERQHMLAASVWGNGTVSMNGYNMKGGQKYDLDIHSHDGNGVDYTLSLSQMSSSLSEYSVSGRYHNYSNKQKGVSVESEKSTIDYYFYGFSAEFVNVPNEGEEGTFTVNENGKAVDFELLNSQYIQKGMSYEFCVGETIYFKPDDTGTYTIKITDTNGGNVGGGVSLYGNDGFMKASAYNYSEDELKITYHNMEKGKRYSYYLYPHIDSDTGEAMCKVELICDSIGAEDYSVTGEIANVNKNTISIRSYTHEEQYNKYTEYRFYLDKNINIEQLPLPNDIGVFCISSDNIFKSSEILENSEGLIRLTDGQSFENISSEDGYNFFAFYPTKAGESYKVTLNDDFDGRISIFCPFDIDINYRSDVLETNKNEIQCYNLDSDYCYVIEVRSYNPISISFNKEEITDTPVTLNGVIDRIWYWDDEIREFSFTTENDSEYATYYFTNTNWQINNDEDFIDGDNVALNIYPKSGVVEIAEANNVILEVDTDYSFEASSSQDYIFSFVPKKSGTYTLTWLPVNEEDLYSGRIDLLLNNSRDTIASSDSYGKRLTYYNMKAGTKYKYRYISYYGGQNIKVRITQDAEGLKEYNFPAIVTGIYDGEDQIILEPENSATSYYLLNETQKDVELGRYYFFTISEDNKIIDIDDVPPEYGYEIGFSTGIKEDDFKDYLYVYTNDGKMEKIPLSSQLNNSIISEISSYIGPVAYKKSYSYYDSSVEYIYELYKIDTKQSLNNAEFNNGFKGLEYNITEDTVIYNGKSIEKINSNIGNALKNGVKYDIDVVSYDADNNARALWIKNYSSDSMVEGLPEYFTFNNGNATLEFTPNISGTYQFELIDDAASISLKEKQSQMQMAQSRGYYVENLMCYNLIAGKKYIVDLSSYYSTDDNEKVAVISLQREGLSEFEIRGSIERKKNDLYEVYNWDNDIYYFLKSDIEIDENELDFADGLYSDGYIKVDKNNHISGYEEAPKYIDYNIGYSYGIVQDFYYGSNYNYVKLDTGNNCSNVTFAYSVRINGERYYNYDDMPELNGVVLYQTNDDGEIYNIFNNDTSLQSELLEYDAKNQTFAGLNYKMTDDTLVFDNEAEWGIPIHWSDYSDGEKYLVTVIACDRYDNARAIVIGGLLPEKLIVNDYGKTEYIQGEMLDLSDLSISCQYQNGSTKDITEQVIIADIDETIPLTAGNYNYKVSYTENGTTVTTTIAIKVTIPLESISVSGDLAVGSTLVPEVLPENASVYYEWYRSDNNVNWTILSNDASYKLQKEDENSYIKVVARGINLYSGTVSYITEKISSDNVKPEIQDAFASKKVSTKEVNISYEYSDNDCLESGILYVSFDNGETYEQIDEKDYSSNKLSSDKGVFVVDTTKYDDGEMTFKITVFDKSGNESEPKYIKYILDNTAPGIPRNLRVYETQEYNYVIWDNGLKERDFNCFNIYRSTNDSDFEKINSINTLGYRDYNILPNNLYKYYLTSEDKTRNESEPSNIAAAEVFEDITPPEVVSYLPYEYEKQYKTVSLKASLYDNYKISHLIIEYAESSSDDYVILDEISVNEKSKVVSYNWDIADFSAGKYKIRYTVIDEVGNKSQPKIVEYNIGEYTLPEKPLLTAESAHRSVALSFDYNGNSELFDYYNVYRKKADEDSFVQIGRTRSNSKLDYVEVGEYIYKIKAVDKYGSVAESDEITAYSVISDNTPPVAVISNENILSATNISIVFEGSYSRDNDKIVKYEWDFGDGNTEDGKTVNHFYEEKGDYTVTLTVYDEANNKNSATLPVKIIDKNDDRYIIANFTTLSGDDDSVLANSTISVINTENSQETALISDGSGSAVVVLEKGNYVVSASNGENVLTNQDLSLDNDTGTIDIPLKLNRAKYLKGSIKTHEMNYDEIVAAGIDVSNPENMFVYKYEATLVYEWEEFELTYYCDDKGTILHSYSGGGGGYGGWWPSGGSGGGYGSGYYVRPLGNNGDSIRTHQYFLVISGEVGFLKQMFEVELLLLNTSEDDWVENCSATLNLPEGLSFAALNSGNQNATLTVNGDGKIEKNGKGNAKWYVKGDITGSYDLSVDVTGDYYPEPAEHFTKTFITQEPIVIRDASKVLQLDLLDVPTSVKHGKTVPISLKVTNVSDHPVYGLTMSMNGQAKSEKKSVNVLNAGASETISIDITFNFSSSDQSDIEYRLISSSFVCSNNVPTTVHFVDLPDEDGESELKTEIQFYEDYDESAEEKWQHEIKTLNYACGSFSWDKANAKQLEEPEKTNFDKLNMKVKITNIPKDDGEQKTATNVKVVLKAPDGFSFNETETQENYTLNIDLLEVGEDKSKEKNVVLYPMYSEKYNGGETLTFESTTSSDVHSENKDKVGTVSITKNENEGKIILRNSFDESEDLEYHLFLDLNGLESNSSTYNHDLAKLSAALSAATYRYATSELTFRYLGFSDIKHCNYDPTNIETDQQTVNKDQVACVFAKKRIVINNEIYTLVAIAIRGTLGKEWYSNFDVGNDEFHRGFFNAKVFVLSELVKYMQNKNLSTDKTKMLITGHSRAAAVADLLSADLMTVLANRYASPQNLYVYTFAAPKSVSESIKYNFNNIFNIVNANDVVTCLPDGYNRIGYDLNINRRINSKKTIFDSGFSKLTNRTFVDWNPIAYNSLKDTIPVLSKHIDELNCNILVSEMGTLINGLIGVTFFSDRYELSSLATVSAVILGVFAPDAIRRITKNKTLGDYVSDMLLTKDKNLLTEFGNWFSENLQSNIWYNHSIECYISWMNTFDSLNDYDNNSTYRYVSVQCPVNVEVYDSTDTLIAQIIENQITYADGIYCAVNGDEKVFILGEDEYTFKITGNDNGKMDITVIEYDADGNKTRVLNYNDIAVVNGETSTMLAGEHSEDTKAVYLLTLNSGDEKPADDIFEGNQLDNVEIAVNVEGSGYAVGGKYTKGETVTLIAVENDSDFAGWYENNELVSEDDIYSFVCENERTLTARFAAKDLPEIENVQLAGYEGVYDGAEHTLSVNIPEGAGIKYSTDGENYTDTLENYKNVCNQTIHYVVSMEGHKDKTGSAAVKISQKELSDSMIESITAHEYTGSQIKPEITLKDGEPSIITAADYDISYGENVSVSTGGTVTVTGKGNYTGEVKKSFGINKKDISISSLGVFDKVYDGTTDAIINASSVTFEGVVDGDSVSLDVDNAEAKFVSSDIGDNITVEITKLAIGGSSAENYNLTNTSYSTKANIKSNITAAYVANQIKSVIVDAQDTTLKLPTVPNGYTVTLKSTSDKTVVSEKGEILAVETEKTVDIVLMVSSADGTDTADTDTITITVPAREKVTVTVISGGNGTVTGSGEYFKNTKVTIIATANSGYTFDGWYDGNTLISSNASYSFEALDNIYLTAKFKTKSSGGGGGGGGGAGGGAASVNVPVKPDTNIGTLWSNPFTDVSEKDWFYEAVKFANENKLFKGISDNEFAPNESLTRGMLATVLYRIEGEPQANASSKFTDIGNNEYYTNAIIWAEENGIVNGITDTEFAPNTNITREQIAAIIFRYAKNKGMIAENKEMHYTDLEMISDWAIDAVSFCYATGIMMGDDTGAFNPKKNATRAETAAILQRYLK